MINRNNIMDISAQEHDELFQATFEQIPVGIAHVAPSGQWLRVNQRLCDIVGYTREEMLTRTFRDITYADDLDNDLDHLQRMLSGEIQSYSTEKRYIRRDHSMLWVSLTVTLLREKTGEPRYFISVTQDIDSRKKVEQLLIAQNRLLELIATGVPLVNVLEEINRFVESQLPDALCSILLLDEAGRHLHSGAAASLPAAYNEVIDGVAIGPNVGSCGTAAWLQQAVVVADIASDPRWKDYRDLALGHGLYACWSYPIFSTTKKVLGTFALYYREPRKPDPQHEIIFTRAAQLAGIVIERERNETEHRRSEALLSAAFENLPLDFWAMNIEGRYTLQNTTSIKQWGRLIDRNPDEVDVPDQIRALWQENNNRAFAGEIVTGETSYPKNNELHYFDQVIAPIREDGAITGILGANIDITERKRVEQQLFAEKERAQVTLKSIGDAVITTDGAGRVDYLNPVAETLTGWSLSAAQGRWLSEIFPVIDEDTRKPVPDPVKLCLTGEQVFDPLHYRLLLNRTGAEYAIQYSAAPIRDRDARIQGLVLVFSDVSEQRRLAAEISHQARHDALTGLINRHEFERRLERIISTVQIDHSEHILCYLDLDQFKVVNDTCGHAAGDELLRQLAQLFSGKIRQRDTLARLGGDEFGLLLEHCSLVQAQRVAETLRQALAEFLFAWEDKSFRLSVSIGMVPINVTSGNLSDALQAADSACYVAKDSGRNRIHVYTPDDIELVQRHGELLWVNHLQEALEQNRFELHAQRIVPVNPRGDGSIHYELLLRLLDTTGKMLSPGAFIPAAERYNLAPRIDRWVIEHAFRAFNRHTHLLESLELIAINLSGASLSEPVLQTFILEQLDQSIIPAEKICFEITETAVISNLTVADHFISVLKQRGCRFALDDFGSGLSSFAYLRNLPVDFLKIDGMFVKDIVDDLIDLAMVRSINEIGQLMGKKTIAEYVENEAILECLRSIGVDYAQGYGIARPRPLAELLTAR